MCKLQDANTDSVKPLTICEFYWHQWSACLITQVLTYDHTVHAAVMRRSYLEFILVCQLYKHKVL